MIWLYNFLKHCDTEAEIILHTKDDREICCTVRDALRIFKNDYLRSALINHFAPYDGWDAIEIWLEEYHDAD